MTDHKITKAMLHELIAGTEGVPDGPYEQRSTTISTYLYALHYGQLCNAPIPASEWQREDGQSQAKTILAHFARCDPATIRAMASLALEALALRVALIYAKPLVEKWCHYQGDNAEFHERTLRPIDAALAAKEGNPPAPETQNALLPNPED